MNRLPVQRGAVPFGHITAGTTCAQQVERYAPDEVADEETHGVGGPQHGGVGGVVEDAPDAGHTHP